LFPPRRPRPIVTVVYTRNDPDRRDCTVTVNASDRGALETEWFRISSPRTWICDQDGSCDLRCAWRCSSRRIRRIGSLWTYWGSDRRPSRGRGRWSSRYSPVLSVVLPSLLVSLLPTIPVLSAVLSDNGPTHVPTVSHAMDPSACLRILVDAALRFKCRINRTYYVRPYKKTVSFDSQSKTSMAARSSTVTNN